MTSFTVAVAIHFAQLVVIEKDYNDYNHLFQIRDSMGRDLLLSWTGKVPLGKEGNYVLIKVNNMVCKEVIKEEAAPNGMTIGVQSYLCDAQQVTK